MFNIGPGELIGLLVIGMVLVGPDKLPKLTVDAARMIKKMRTLASRATLELRENLGPGFEDLEVKDLHPKTFIKKQLAGALDEETLDSVKAIGSNINSHVSTEFTKEVDEMKKLKEVAKIDPDLL